MWERQANGSEHGDEQLGRLSVIPLHCVQVEVTIAVVAQDGREVVVDSRPSLTFMVAGGGVVGALQAAVLALHPQGIARCRWVPRYPLT
jgi:hypothetical protein